MSTTVQAGDVAIDYSYARPFPDRIVAAGVQLVVRYISPNRAHPKNLTLAERDALHRAGLGILLVWENAVTDPLQGAPLGAAHGTMARNYVQYLGYPPDLEILVAVDFNVQASQVPTVVAHLNAFRGSSGWPQGTYGKDSIVTIAANAGLSTLGWQTVAWSQGRISPHAHVLQHARPVHPSVPPLGAVDDNTVLRPFKVWSTVPDPAPPPQPPPEDDMTRALFNCKDAGTLLWAEIDAGGAALQVWWTGYGDDPNVKEAIRLHTSAPGLVTADIAIANLAGTYFRGTLPATLKPEYFANAAELRTQLALLALLSAPPTAVDQQARDDALAAHTAVAHTAAELVRFETAIAATVPRP